MELRLLTRYPHFGIGGWYLFGWKWDRPLAAESEYSEVTHLLQLALQGDPQAEQVLLAHIYERLIDEAEAVLFESSGSLDAPQLVNEVWLRIFRGAAAPQFEQRHAFFAYAARTMRNLLVDHVRHKRTQKAGGGRARLPLDLDLLVGVYREHAQVDLIDLNDALEELKGENERLFRTVEMKFFGGATMQQIADFHGVSLTTAENDWALARAKLRRRLHDGFCASEG